ncbi:hypothetical protein RI129_007447 [Pyrocoelia pectoralis]|uniref:SKA complex subunit 1 n=1 Tax=Pyrocoelia pectoralis TaxID=417401 RepID=A0AAN7V9P5_9COLE
MDISVVNLQSLCDKIDILKLTLDFVSFGKTDKNSCSKLINEINERNIRIKLNLELMKKLMSKYCSLFHELQTYEDLIKNKIKKIDELAESVGDCSSNSLIIINSPEIGNLNLNGSIAFSDFTPTVKYQNNYKRAVTPKYLTFDIAPLSCEEFKSLPKYMVGRLTLEAINNFIDVVSEALFKKYNLLSKPLHTIKSTETQLYREYKQQQCGIFKAQRFVTEEDIARECNKSILDKRALNFLTILRHTKRLTRATLLGKSVYMCTN